MEHTVLVGIAEMKIAEAPIILRTNLGSCIAICLYNREKKVGGLLHFMLPDSKLMQYSLERSKKAKFADTGLAELLKQLELRYQLGPKDFIAKIFGGAKMLPVATSDIGVENKTVAETLLKQYSISLVAQKTGGEKGYKIDFHLDTGKIICQSFGNKEEEY